jgi:hypothetical protein
MTLVETINKAWGWTGVAAHSIHHKSPMGHIVFSDSNDCFYYLDTDGLDLSKLGLKQEAEEYLASEDAQEVWLAANLVNAARKRLGDAPEGNVFTLHPLALLEGRYSADEMIICSHAELITFTGDSARQLKDLPEGAQFQIEVVD